MRIVAGAFRGRRLHTPKNDRIRPTIDKVRESVFNIIAEEVPGAKVLDLFAGTGAMGLEALSRGARFCLFVDNGSEAVRLIRENIKLLAADDLSKVIHGTASSAIRRLSAQNELFDLIFMDPPYGKGYVEETFQIVCAVAGDGSLVVAEQHIKDSPPRTPAIWQKNHERRYGDTLILIYSKSDL